MRKHSLRWFTSAGMSLAVGIWIQTVAVVAAQAQTGTLRVEVVRDARPVERATVRAGSVSAVTDASGIARLTLPAGSSSVVVSANDWAADKFSIDVTAGVERSVRLLIDVAAQQATLVVATTRAGRELDQQAVPIAVIGRDRIDTRMLSAPGDIATVFRAMPGLRVETTSPVLGTTMVRIQGLPARYTRLLWDGVPLFSDRPGGHALLRMPPMDLDRIEVIKGAASAWFGSDAAAGAVNLISRKPGAAPNREILFSQSAQGATDGVFWISTPATGESRTWSSTFLASAHRQEEKDVDDDGWSDLPEYSRGVVRPRVFWNNGKGRSVSGVADVTFEKREGGSAFAREALETKTADGALFGEMALGNGSVLSGAGTLFVQSRARDFSDVRERDRLQTATFEMTLRRPGERHTWLAGMEVDWFAVRSLDALPSTYVSTRGGIFVQDDLTVAEWLVLSGTVRLDHHNLYDLLLSPRGSALFRGGPWAMRFSAGQAYFTPRYYNEETEAAGIAHLTIGPLEKETARSFSADVSHKTGVTTVTLAVFRHQIDDPAQVDRATYTLRTQTDPIVARGAEVFATVRRAPLALTGSYTYVSTRERGGLELPRTPRHSGAAIAALAGRRGRIGVEVSFTGKQRLDRNPYRSISEAYTLVAFGGEARFGRLRVFVNAENLTDVRQTDWDPIGRLLRDVDGRWTVDAWAPLAGRIVNGGLRIVF